ncbi:hypothetical protein ScPMuIL_005882 [Solemya velum]
MLCQWQIFALLVLLASFGSVSSVKTKDCLDEYRGCIKMVKDTLKTKKQLEIGRINCRVLYYYCIAKAK